jgi:hypothetical protein
VFQAPEGFETYTWLGMSYMNWVMLKVADLLSGRGIVVGLVVIVVMVACGYMWVKEMQKREAEFA